MASFLIWFVDGSNILNLDDIGIWAQPTLVVVAILSGCLFVSSIIPDVWKATEGYRLEKREKALRRKRTQDFIEDIPFLTKNEKTILGYLRHHKQKRFNGAADAGRANTLLSKGYIRCILVRGQVFDPNGVPFEVSSLVWEVLEARPDDFPYSPQYSDRSNRVEVYPWHDPS